MSSSIFSVYRYSLLIYLRISRKKLAQLTKGSDHLTEKYGEKGTLSREEFEAKAKAWYFAELLRDERKRQKLTQQQLGERIGKKREGSRGRFY